MDPELCTGDESKDWPTRELVPPKIFFLSFFICEAFQRTMVGDMDPPFYSVEKMSAQKGKLEKPQKLTWKMRRRKRTV